MTIVVDLQGVIVPLLAIGLAEMGDKTQLSILLLSSRTDKYIQLLMGVLLAFLIVDGTAILLGSWITTLVSPFYIRVISALIFIVFGILILRGGAEEGADRLASGSPLVSGFSMIFLAEWGDKTQIASALFATEYDPLMVLIGTMTALAIVSAMAIFLGRFISGRVDRRLISKAAGILFILIGISFAASALMMRM